MKSAPPASAGGSIDWGASVLACMSFANATLQPGRLRSSPLSLSIASETIIRPPANPALLLKRAHVASHSQKSIRRFCLAAMVAVSVCAVVRTQTAGRGREWQNPLPQGNAISAIRFAGDKLHGWAVGADGVILYTSDGGFRWETQPTRLVNALNGLYVFDRQHVFAVGARGLILETRSRNSQNLRERPSLFDYVCFRRSPARMGGRNLRLHSHDERWRSILVHPKEFDARAYLFSFICEQECRTRRQRSRNHPAHERRWQTLERSRAALPAPVYRRDVH